VDTFEQPAIESAKQEKRRRRSVEEKRRIVEETLEAGGWGISSAGSAAARSRVRCLI